MPSDYTTAVREQLSAVSEPEMSNQEFPYPPLFKPKELDYDSSHIWQEHRMKSSVQTSGEDSAAGEEN